MDSFPKIVKAGYWQVSPYYITTGPVYAGGVWTTDLIDRCECNTNTRVSEIYVAKVFNTNKRVSEIYVAKEGVRVY